jgi:hypothetical protein
MDTELQLAKAQIPSIIDNSILSSMRSLYKKITETKTPLRAIKEREGRAGNKWKYCKSTYYEEELSHYFPGWSYEIKEWKIIGDANQGGFVVATVRIHVIDHNIHRIIDDIGGQEIKYYGNDHETRAGEYLDISNDVKAAVTDGIKRCATRLGIAIDMKIDPSDMSITEEQMGFLKYCIQDAKPENQAKVLKMSETINAKTFRRFMSDKILPIVQKNFPERYKEIKHINFTF